jgi:hypothetical protein
MMEYLQETDSKIVFNQPGDVWVEFPDITVNETVGRNLYTRYFPLFQESSIVKRAFEILEYTENPDVAREAKILLSQIQDVLQNLQIFGFDLDYLPELKAFNVDDGSVLLEWVLSDFRLGFSLEIDPQESGWYLVTNRKLGEISASGYISKDNNNSLILWLINFLLANT